MKKTNINGCFYGRQTPNKYEIDKQRAREKAIEWQLENCNKCLYMSELAYYGTYFSKIGKRYGLLKEFRENGII